MSVVKSWKKMFQQNKILHWDMLEFFKVCHIQRGCRFLSTNVRSRYDHGEVPDNRHNRYSQADNLENERFPFRYFRTTYDVSLWAELTTQTLYSLRLVSRHHSNLRTLYHFAGEINWHRASQVINLSKWETTTSTEDCAPGRDVTDLPRSDWGIKKH